MNQIQQITNDPYQKQTFILPDGTTLGMVLQFKPMQYGWFIETLTYGSVVISGLRICNSPNMLYQFKNQVPFGLACFTTGNREPSQQDDFSSGASIMYLLTAAEVKLYEDFLSV